MKKRTLPNRFGKFCLSPLADSRPAGMNRQLWPHFSTRSNTGLKVFIGSKAASKCSDTYPAWPRWISEHFEATFDPINTLSPVNNCNLTESSSLSNETPINAQRGAAPTRARETTHLPDVSHYSSLGVHSHMTSTTCLDILNHSPVV